MNLIDGKATAAQILEQLAEYIRALPYKPGLCVILIGNNPASQAYVNAKIKACNKIGIYSELIVLPENVSESYLLNKIYQLNEDKNIHGILVQLPLPKHISPHKVIEAIDYRKDVDGFHPINMGRLAKGLPALVPCTPKGIQELLKFYNIQTEGKHCVIIGRSNIVGMPMSVMMMQNMPFANATVTVCHSKTKDIEVYTRQADILIVAVGSPKKITGDMLKEGCVVIDVGINRIENENRYQLVGDVDFESAAQKASYITPVPGGVGPMTIAMLMKNTVEAAESLYKSGLV
ncbi:MAG: bifunctional methylenetetrahydrofolate dehydrogenase/methenyltetrahydrofolate cyclohydrolase FolD [Bacteroidia bacterium]|nr:bifunctional methylenetetrahydrofolate dehydrogenase/methenyltetrahydrofolate cyclohydrolase FolD [Bacteroidia bacterium]MDW8302914.1 bifunctional methylenetetrahydrofolate dehydrogenase/methenyltetrahydrofolate cyclohydrolase FolD [Bacteroidia bacterium]